MSLTKTIVLPDKYLKDDKNLNYVKENLERSYEYLGKNKVSYETLRDRIITNIDVSDNETLILNNIELYDNNGLKIKINPNTISSEVVTLRIDDKYSEGEFVSRMVSNGYVCK